MPFNEHGILPTIVFLHGRDHVKDWGIFPDAFIELAERGYAVISYNHAQLSIQQELDDLSVMLDAIRKNEFGAAAGLFSMYPVGVIGHSHGAYTALVAAAERDDIMSVVTWSAIAEIPGVDGDDVSAMKRVAQLYIPCCFIHGMADEVNSYRDSDKLYQACVSREKDRILLEKADHTYGGTQPFLHDDLPKAFSDVLDQTVKWFQSTMY